MVDLPAREIRLKDSKQPPFQERREKTGTTDVIELPGEEALFGKGVGTENR
jgi:hypothetical protein